MSSFSYWIMCRLRFYRFDGNPLRRRSDRIETVAVMVALLVFIAVLWPVVALGRRTYADGLQAELTGPAQRKAVVAEIVDKPCSPGCTVGSWMRTVRWITPEGTLRTGRTILPANAPAGSRAKIWVDGADRLTASPQGHDRTVVVTGSVVVITVVGAAMILLLCLAGVRALLNRRREAEWERAWILADRRWRRPRQS